MRACYHKARAAGYTPPVRTDGADSSLIEAVWDVVSRRTLDRAHAAVELCQALIQSEGGLKRSGDQLLVGDRDLQQDREFLARLARACGLGFCIYAGNRRIATATVLDAGIAPDLGAHSSALLSDTCLRRRENFKGHIDYGGRRYLVVAAPLFEGKTGQRDGQPVGILEVFQDERSHLDLMGAAVRAGMDEQLAAVTQRNDSMDQITSFIDDVGRRLQLLALNGNIIAAQAGEHGRAFRVVCRELGSLAEQAKQTAEEVGKVATALGVGGQGDDPFGSLTGTREAAGRGTQGLGGEVGGTNRDGDIIDDTTQTMASLRASFESR